MTAILVFLLFAGSFFSPEMSHANGNVVPHESVSVRFPTIYKWAVYFPGEGAVLYALSSKFIFQHIWGKPFTWDSLEEASGGLCLSDAQNVEISRILSWHIVKGDLSKGQRQTVSSGTRSWTYERIAELDFRLLKERFEPGGVYSISVNSKGLGVREAHGCKGELLNGPVQVAIIPDRNQRGLLTLRALGTPERVKFPEHVASSRLEPEIVRFTMTADGPRLFDADDLHERQDPRPLLFGSFVLLALIILGGPLYALGYFEEIFRSFRHSPLHRSWADLFTQYLVYLSSWRTVAYPAAGVAVYFLIVLTAATAANSLAVSFDGAESPRTIFGLSPLVETVSLSVMSAALLFGIYHFWARQWLSKQKVYLLAAISLAALVSYTFIYYLDTYVLDLFVLGTGLAALVCMYLRGLREAHLRQSEGHLSVVVWGADRKVSQLVIFGRSGEYLVAIQPDSRSIVMIPNKDILEIRQSGF